MLTPKSLGPKIASHDPPTDMRSDLVAKVMADGRAAAADALASNVIVFADGRAAAVDASASPPSHPPILPPFHPPSLPPSPSPSPLPCQKRPNSHLNVKRDLLAPYTAGSTGCVSDVCMFMTQVTYLCSQRHLL